MHASFVSLGQLVKFAYDATGILPKKRVEKTALTDQDVKRIQKQLERLVDEEGSLLDRCGELIQTLSNEIKGTIPNEKVFTALGECLLDLLQVYNDVIRDEGTYLLPRDSVRWFAGAYAVPRLVVSVQRHILRFNIAGEGFIHPADKNWYLPEITDDSICWPLEKAMQWVYQYCKTSPTHFHCAGKTHLECDVEMRQNLENAFNWRTGQTLPSWAGLHWNFSRSIDRLVATDGSSARAISAKEKESMLYVLFFARMSSYVTKLVYDVYGKAALVDLVSRFKRQRDWLSTDVQVLKDQTVKFLEQAGGSGHSPDAVWFFHSKHYWELFADRAAHCGKAIQKLLITTKDRSLGDAEALQLCEKYGEYTVRSALDSLSRDSDLNPPLHFAEALFKGIDLSKSESTTLEEIGHYEADAREKDVIHCLEWMVHWNRARLLYRNGSDSDAFQHIAKAFELAKYSAGRNQYEIVNQFIEIAAKNDSWKEFKKGVVWALYLGMSVRWLRNDEPTEEKLRGVFNLMKLNNLRYQV
jgi:hypothetical protein